MGFFEKIGKVAVGSRLRMLTDKITHDAVAIYGLYGVDLKPKWFPVFCVLADEQPKSITAIAREIGHSHPSVSTIVKEMSARGIVTETPDDGDRRRSLIGLSPYGKEMARELTVQCRDVEKAVEQLSKESDHDLWAAIADWERLLSVKSLFDRVRTIKEERERAQVKIVPFASEHRDAFRELNRQWIERYWQLEPHDKELLDDPEKHIIGNGGHIFVALFGDTAVGVCALCATDSPATYELAKLAVDNSVLRKGIGRLLCEAAIRKARELGSERLFLESNTRLKPAIALYRKLGFRELSEYHPAYARGDIQMEMMI